MIKLLGNVVVLAIIYVAMMTDPATQAARSAAYHQSLAAQIGLYGILSLAAGVLIVTGGIDLSMGSAVALCSVVLVQLLMSGQVAPTTAILLVLLLGACIGLINGVLVGVLRIQAFVVTLCFLFIYRSAARVLTRDQVQGLSTQFVEVKDFFNGSLYGVPVHFLIFLGLLLVFGIFLHFSVYGRYFYAIGSNERAAQYCGIPTTRYRILAYVICSTLTALFAVLNLLKMNSVQPSQTGEALELNGIAAAVLGGCSLRGGEGNVLGILLGTCIIYILPSYAIFKGFDDYYEPALFGGVLLIAAIADELLRRYYSYRRT